MQLIRIGKLARATATETSAFPMGSTDVTPRTACCDQDDRRCVPSPADWEHPVWKQLGFAMEDRFRFQYSFRGDGSTFEATARGDLSCDGRTTTLTIHGRISNGQPVIDDGHLLR